MTQKSDLIKQSWQNPESRARRIASLRQAWTPEKKERRRLEMLAKHQTPEYKMAQRQGLIEWRSKPEVIEKMRIAKDIEYSKPEIRQKHRVATLKRYENPKEHEKTRQQTLKRYEDPKERELTGLKSREYWSDPKVRDAKRLEMLERWADPIYKSRVVRATVKANLKSPNIPETIITNVLDTYFPNDWEFIGNNEQEEVGGKLPDFKHKTNPWLIEHFGDFHHADNNTRIKPHQKYNGTVEFYNNHGYKILILWEHEVKGRPLQEIADKIRKFFY